MDIRKAIEVEANSWVGTPYERGCMHKGRGVDCYRLEVGILRALKLIPNGYKPIHLHRDWMRGKTVDKDTFRREIVKYFYEITPDEILPGDMVSFMYNNTESHVATVVSDSCIIHACENIGMVVKQRMRCYSNICSAYRLKELKDVS